MFLFQFTKMLNPQRCQWIAVVVVVGGVWAFWPLKKCNSEILMGKSWIPLVVPIFNKWLRTNPITTGQCNIFWPPCMPGDSTWADWSWRKLAKDWLNCWGFWGCLGGAWLSQLIFLCFFINLTQTQLQNVEKSAAICIEQLRETKPSKWHQIYCKILSCLYPHHLSGWILIDGLWDQTQSATTWLIQPRDQGTTRDLCHSATKCHYMVHKFGYIDMFSITYY